MAELCVLESCNLRTFEVVFTSPKQHIRGPCKQMVQVGESIRITRTEFAELLNASLSEVTFVLFR